MTIKQRIRQQAGFALVEVLLAALVLAVGSAAFLKLQTLTLKHSHNNYARTQATTIAISFVEQLRSNRGFMDLPAANRTDSIIGGAVALVAAPQNSSDCQSSNPSSDCALATLNYQRYLISEKMRYAFRPNMSLLCYRENAGGYLRLTYLWRDSLSADKTVLTAANCPTAFNTAVAAQSRNNSVTLYVQL